MRVVVTGASGFIGKALVAHLLKMNFDVCAVTNKPEISLNLGVPKSKIFSIGELSVTNDWSLPLAGADCVIHCAARAHVIQDHESNSLTLFREVNVDAAANLARQAANMGVKKFIFLSSIGVFGSNSNDRAAFSEFDEPSPVDDFAIAKFEAEKQLTNISKGSPMGLTIVRLPLVYGYGVRGNFGRLLKLVKLGLPLPLAAFSNKRSYVAIGNLVDFLSVCLVHSDASDKIFHVSDDQDVSTPELLACIGEASRRRVRLFYFPLSLLYILAGVFKRQSELNRLASSFQISINYSCRTLEWTPKIKLREGLSSMLNSG